MSRKDKINTEQLREQAEEAGKAARQLADQGKDWATPKVEAALEWAGPRVDKAWRTGVTAAAPVVADYAERSKDVVDTAHDKIVDDVIPRVIAAMEEAAKAAQSGSDNLQVKANAALDAAAAAVAEQEKKAKGGSKVGKTIGWVLVAGAVAGAGVLIWRRTQPVDDPWAEEYWDDAVAAPAAGEGAAATVAEKAKHVAEDAKAATAQAADKASEVKDQVAEKAGEVKDQVAEKATRARNQAADKANEAANSAADKTEEVKDTAKDAAKDVQDKADDAKNT
ncbi:hypothetical protein [Occultella glacieicola]|uniref:hypothetical protein n=1 Tax=Occultella glacieicola TaxID=2518684 RepID=UPI0014046A49|nr:hypothetical protein [Occultella glacieicola]